MNPFTIDPWVYWVAAGVILIIAETFFSSLRTKGRLPKTKSAARLTKTSQETHQIPVKRVLSPANRAPNPKQTKKKVPGVRISAMIRITPAATQ